MDSILHMVKNVTLFLIMGNILSNLFNGSSYRKYFTYTTGVIVIVIVLSPLFSFLNDEKKIEKYLKESIISNEQIDMKAEISIEEKRMKEKIWREYEERIAKLIVSEYGVLENECEVKANEDSIIIYIKKTPNRVNAVIKDLSNKLGVKEDDIEFRLLE